MKKIFFSTFIFLAIVPMVLQAQILFPNRGGTGGSTIPILGQVLVGQSDGTYAPQATSTLGLGGSGGGSGTVTSVAQTVPTGFTISGSPITTSGTLAISFDTGYSLPTNASQTQWDSAFSWGDHSLEGYLTTVDISDNTNLAGDSEIVLTNDTLSIASSIARDSELHDATTLAGEDYLSLSTQLITANAINPDNLASADFGSFTCNGTNCTIDNNSITPDMVLSTGQTDEYCLSYESTGSTWEWKDCSGGGGGSSLFTDDGTFTYLTSTTDDLVLGGSATSTSPFFFDVSSSSLLISSASAAGTVALEGVDILVSSAGTLTLSNVDAIDATTETTLEAAIDSLVNLTTVGTIGTGVWNGTAIDISDYTNLAGDSEIVLTNDTLSIAASIARDSELHDPVSATDSSEIDFTVTGQDITASLEAGSIDETKLDTSVNASLDLADSAAQPGDLHSAVTLAGEDYLSLSTQLITANAINADNLSASDFGDFTCNGTTCSLDTGSVSDNEIDYTTVTLNDLTFDVGSVSKTEFGYLNGVTSAIQTQLNSKIEAGSTDTLTNKTINGDNNTISNLDIGNEVDWAVATDVTDAGTPATGDKLLIFEDGVGLRKIDWDDLPSGGGSGDVVGPASATDNAIVRYDSTTGKLIQNSSISINDAGAIDTLALQAWNIVRPDGTVTASFLDEGYQDSSTSDSVNYIQITNQVSGFAPGIASLGSDTNIDIRLVPKGTGITELSKGFISTASSTIIEDLTVGGYATATAFMADFGTDGSPLFVNGSPFIYTDSDSNTALGTGAMESLTTGEQNFALGAGTFGDLTTGNFNVGIGAQNSGTITIGSSNVNIGRGIANGVTNSSRNTLVGDAIGVSGVDGNDSTCIGAGACVAFFGDLPDRTTVIGSAAAPGSDADENIVIGYSAGTNLGTGDDRNIVIGYDVDAPTNSAVNTLNIGNLIFGTGIDGTVKTLSSGNIGIGTISPSGKLDVLGADNSVAITARINAASAGVTASDTFIDFRSTSGSIGSIAGTAVSGVIAYNTFTGSHWSSIDVLTSNEFEMRTGDNFGYLVESTGETLEEFGHLTKSRMSCSRGSQAVYGVYGGKDNDDKDFVLSLGTGYMWVFNKGEDLAVGDLLMSSDECGFAEKQKAKFLGLWEKTDNIVGSITAGKVMENITWNEGEKFRKVAVIYLGG